MLLRTAGHAVSHVFSAFRIVVTDCTPSFKIGEDDNMTFDVSACGNG